MHVLAVLGALLAVVAASGRMMTKHEIRERQLEAAKRWQTSDPQSVKRSGVHNITFTNPKASGDSNATSKYLIRLIHVLPEFYVDGKSLPLVDFDVGPSWAGLLPISNNPNETRKVCARVVYARHSSADIKDISSFFGFSLPVPKGVLMI